MQTVSGEQAAGFEALLGDVLQWDGSLARAAELRERAARLGQLARKPTSPGERALLAVCSAYQKQKADRLCGDWRSEPDACAVFGPFLGDPALGAWSWRDPLHTSDADARRWLELVGRHAPTDDPAVMRFVRTMFQVRRRDVWVPAANALAALAVRSEPIFAELRDRFAECFPSGLPTTWPARGLAGAAVNRDVHLVRHALYAACAWAAEGGDVGRLVGFSAGQLAASALPGDDSDASVVLLGLRALVAGKATRPQVLPHLVRRVGEATADEMQEEVLRGLADDLRDDAAAGDLVSAIEKRLCEPRWRSRVQTKRLDSLWSWLATARWFKSRNDLAALEQMETQAAEAAEVLALCVDGTLPGGLRDPVEALLPRLRTVLDDAVFNTTVDTERVVRTTETLLLLDHVSIASLSWKELVARACGREAAAIASEGPVRRVARAHLVTVHGERNLAPAILLRDAELDESVVRALASATNGFAARQVAVQLERLLRTCAPGEPQVKLLWSVLAQTPPAETLPQLREILRGTATPLHDLVDSLGELDALRRATHPDSPHLGEAMAAYERVAGAVKRLSPTPGGDARPAGSPSTAGTGAAEVGLAERIERLARLLREAAAATMADTPGVCSSEWCAALEALLLGDGQSREGIERWMDWLGMPLKNLEEYWQRFHEALRAVRVAGEASTLPHCDALLAALTVLRTGLSRVPWPENVVVDGALSRARQWAEGRRAAARRSEEAAALVRRLRDQGDEDTLVDLVGKDFALLDHLPADEVRSLSAFLRERLRFVAAHRVWARVRERVQVPALWTHLAPMYVGVAGGTMFLLSGGTAWNDLALPGEGARLAVIVSLALVFSLVLLVGNLVSRMKVPSGSAGRWGLLLRACGRVLPVYASALLLAAGVAALTLWTLQGTGMRVARNLPIPWWRQWVLWSSLTLFMGLFVGLILQGRGVASDRN